MKSVRSVLAMRMQELPEEVSLSDTDEEIDLDAPAPSFPSEIIRTKVLGLTPTTMETALEQVSLLLHNPLTSLDRGVERCAGNSPTQVELAVTHSENKNI